MCTFSKEFLFLVLKYDIFKFSPEWHFYVIIYLVTNVILEMALNFKISLKQYFNMIFFFETLNWSTFFLAFSN